MFQLQKRRLGRTDLEVSVIGFGGIPIIGASKEYAHKMLTYAYELGINYFDTARAYGDSEEKFGEALKLVRDKVILATKTYQKKSDTVLFELKQSLRNLKTDYIDIVLVQRVDDERAFRAIMSEDGALRALKEAKKKEDVGFIGISSHNPYIFSKVIQSGQFDIALVPLSLITREFTEEALELAEKLDVGVVVMKPFGGTDFRFVQSEWNIWNLPVGEFHQIFGKDKEKAGRALRFVLAHSIDTVIPGFSSIEDVESAASVGEGFQGLTEKEKKDYSFGKMPQEPFCRECGACLPCNRGLNIPFILRLYKYHTFYSIRIWSREVYQRLSTKVDDCTNCGQCESKCPYQLPIVNMLRAAHKAIPSC